MRYHVVPSNVTDVTSISTAQVALHVARDNYLQLFDIEELNDHISEALDYIGVEGYCIPQNQFYRIQSETCYNPNSYMEFRFNFKKYGDIDSIFYTVDAINSKGEALTVLANELHEVE